MMYGVLKIFQFEIGNIWIKVILGEMSMKKINFQFHATYEDFVNFIKEIDSSNNIYGVTRFPYSISKLRLDEVSSSTINRYDLLIVTKHNFEGFDNYKTLINNQDNNLVISRGFSDNTKLVESAIWIYSEGKIELEFKQYITNFKKSMLQGAWVVNPILNTKEFYKNCRYTNNAKKSYENGIKICPIAGTNYYELEK